LFVYGSLESDPVYSNECANAIVSLRLTENVFLKGLGNPSNILPSGWVFVNSSKSEGLPLAIGEAGLCGLPVVCTDVGGSREVLSDTKHGCPIDHKLTYGRIVPPQSPSDLAIGIVEVMGMLNGLEQVLDPACKSFVTLNQLLKPAGATLDCKSTPLKSEYTASGSVANKSLLYQRLMDKTVQSKRRHVGLRLRARVFGTFDIKRYLRQHEQQIWIGALQCSEFGVWQMVQKYVMAAQCNNADLRYMGSGGENTQDDNSNRMSELDKIKQIIIKRNIGMKSLEEAKSAASKALGVVKMYVHQDTNQDTYQNLSNQLQENGQEDVRMSIAVDPLVNAEDGEGFQEEIFGQAEPVNETSSVATTDIDSIDQHLSFVDNEMVVEEAL